LARQASWAAADADLPADRRRQDGLLTRSQQPGRGGDHDNFDDDNDLDDIVDDYDYVLDRGRVALRS
jgi:hypothetical protein